MIPFIDLKAQYKIVETEIRARMDAVLAHGRYIMGPEINELEEKLAAFVGARHCLSCSSGTDALLLPLMAWGVGPGDAVFCPPFTFAATAEVVRLTGATPIFVDIDPATFNMDPARLADAARALKARDAKLHPLPAQALEGAGLRPRAVIPVDLFGVPAEYEAIEAIAREHSLLVLEDAAQGFGGEYRGRKACSFGDAAATSFFPAKPLGCYGDGGAVFTDDDGLMEVLESLRVHGQGGVDKYANVRVGLNARMDSLQAAVLLAKLEIFPDEIKRRQDVAQAYDKGLAGVAGLKTPVVPEHCLSAWAQYSALIENPAWDRDSIRGALQELGVPTMVYYPTPLHLQPAYAQGLGPGSMPVSEDMARRIFSLPMHPYLSGEQIGEICAAVAKAAGKAG